jgi:FAD/FMN-containing dehydrogenase
MSGSAEQPVLIGIAHNRRMASAGEAAPAGFEGEVLRPEDAGYDDARRVWNAMIDRRPELILRPTGIADVQAAVRHARATEREISVRGGGHSVVGHAVSDGGVMIDLSRMREVRIDPDAGLAIVQGGALLRDLDTAGAAHGMHVPAGVVSHTGVGGLALGGGEGWLGRRLGLTCDNLRRATVVTAGGAVVIASETDDSDLLWALRGGGGNFGIVTEFVFELHPVDGRVLSFDCFYGPDDGERVLHAFRELALDAPEETTLAAWVGTAGPWPFLREELHGQTLVNMSFIHVGDPEASRAVADAMRAAAPVVHEVEERMTFVELQAASDEAMSHGKRRYWKSHYLADLPEGAVDAFLSRGGTVPEGGLVANGSLEARGGAQARIGPDETAFANRDARFSWITMAAWDDPAEDAARMGAARRFADAMAPHASGVYVNALAESDGPGGLSAAYRPGHLARLARLKARYDPDNAFHLNQNIAPQSG